MLYTNIQTRSTVAVFVVVVFIVAVFIVVVFVVVVFIVVVFILEGRMWRERNRGQMLFTNSQTRSAVAIKVVLWQ